MCKRTKKLCNNSDNEIKKSICDKQMLFLFEGGVHVFG